jgi:hypothetical protein
MRASYAAGRVKALKLAAGRRTGPSLGLSQLSIRLFNGVVRMTGRPFVCEGFTIGAVDDETYACVPFGLGDIPFRIAKVSNLGAAICNDHGVARDVVVDVCRGCFGDGIDYTSLEFCDRSLKTSIPAWDFQLRESLDADRLHSFSTCNQRSVSVFMISSSDRAEYRTGVGCSGGVGVEAVLLAGCFESTGKRLPLRSGEGSVQGPITV